jgi:hypothetical protein
MSLGSKDTALDFARRTEISFEYIAHLGLKIAISQFETFKILNSLHILCRLKYSTRHKKNVFRQYFSWKLNNFSIDLWGKLFLPAYVFISFQEAEPRTSFHFICLAILSRI